MVNLFHLAIHGFVSSICDLKIDSPNDGHSKFPKNEVKKLEELLV